MSSRRLWIAWWTLTRKEVVRVLRIWTQTLLPPAITMGIYFMVFGRFLGGQIRDIEGTPYIQFILPGLVMMSCITNSFSNVASSFFSAKFQRNIEELLIAPLPDWIIVLGYVAGGMVRGLLCGLVVAFVGLAFTSIPVVYPHWVFIYAFASTSLFSLAGLINGLLARKFDDVAIIPTFVLTPLTYFAGVFYSISLLPPTWQKLSLANPILYMVDGFRFGFLGRSPSTNLGVGLTMLVILNLVFYVACLQLVRRGVGLRS